MHVVEAPLIGFPRPYQLSVAIKLVLDVSLEPSRILQLVKRITAIVGRRRSGPARILPLSFRRKVKFPTRREPSSSMLVLCQFPTEIDRVLPSNMRHGIVVAADWIEIVRQFFPRSRLHHQLPLGSC